MLGLRDELDSEMMIAIAMKAVRLADTRSWIQLQVEFDVAVRTGRGCKLQAWGLRFRDKLENYSNTSMPKRHLEQMGIALLDPQEEPAAFAEIQRISRCLHQSGRRSIGFVPADDRVGAAALAVQIALATSQLYEGFANVLDANFVCPQFATLPFFSDVQIDALGLCTVWIAERVTLSTPARLTSSLVFADIARATERAKDRYDSVFVDLTGIACWGEHHSAYDLVDGVAVIAAARKSLERDILRCSDEIPASQRLGVVLIG